MTRGPKRSSAVLRSAVTAAPSRSSTAGKPSRPRARHSRGPAAGRARRGRTSRTCRPQPAPGHAFAPDTARERKTAAASRVRDPGLARRGMRRSARSRRRQVQADRADPQPARRPEGSCRRPASGRQSAARAAGSRRPASGRSRAGSSTSLTARRAVATPTGRLMTKIQCQLIDWVSTPPASSPIEPPADATKP